MAPKGKPPAKAEKDKDAKGKTDGKDKDAKGKEDKTDEPKKPIYMDPKARSTIIITATVMVIVALVVFFLYRVQWNRTIQLIGVVDSLRGILVYRNEAYKAMSDTEILTEIPKLMFYAEVLENKTKFALAEIDRVTKLLDQGWFVYKQHLYYFSTEKKNFDEANNECKKNEALLAYIDDYEERRYLVEIGKEKNYWIGLSRDANKPTWRWVTGAVLGDNYKNWSKAYPDVETSRKCVKQHQCPSKPNRTCWDSLECDRVKKWICKMPPNAVMMSQDDGLLF